MALKRCEQRAKRVAKVKLYILSAFVASLLAPLAAPHLHLVQAGSLLGSEREGVVLILEGITREIKVVPVDVLLEQDGSQL